MSAQQPAMKEEPTACGGEVGEREEQLGWAQDRGDPGQDYMRGGPDEEANELRKPMTTWRQKMPFRRKKWAEEDSDKGVRTPQKRSWGERCVYVLNLIAFVIC